MMKYTGLDNQVYENSGDDGSPSTITNKQYHINNGDCFYGSKTSLALAAAGTFIVHINTSLTKTSHANIEVTAGAKGTIGIYAGTTYSAAGTAITIFNNSGLANTKTTTALAYSAPTETVRGTQIYDGILNATSVDTLGVGQDSKKIIAKNTDLLIVITNTSAGAADFGINFDFFEV